MRPNNFFLLNPCDRAIRNLTPTRCTNKIIRSTTPTLYHVPQQYISKTPQAYNSQYFSVMENNKKSFLVEKSTISTEPINKSYTTFPNKSPINQKNEHKIQSLEEDKERMDQEINELTKENCDLKERIIKFETNGLLERRKYEEKLLQINSELNKRLISEKCNKKTVKTTSDNKLMEKLIDDMKKEHVFAMDTLKKDNKKTVEMYDLLIKEMETHMSELLKKNGMLNLSAKEFERKNRELQNLNKFLSKKNLELEGEKLIKAGKN